MEQKRLFTQTLEKLYSFASQLEEAYTKTHDSLEASEVQQFYMCFESIKAMEEVIKNLRDRYF